MYNFIILSNILLISETYVLILRLCLIDQVC